MNAEKRKKILCAFAKTYKDVEFLYKDAIRKNPKAIATFRFQVDGIRYAMLSTAEALGGVFMEEALKADEMMLEVSEKFLNERILELHGEKKNG